MKTLTMITRHGINKDNISAYTLITSDYQTVTMSAKQLADALKKKSVYVTNMELTDKGLNSTNGALDKYTLINAQTNEVIGTPKAVILDRVEREGKLIGYTVFTQTGTLAELSVADATALADKKLISNGKIKHTSEGDIVSSIGGNYPLREIAIDKAPKGEINVDVLYFGVVKNNKANYVGAIISCTSAAEMSKLIDVINKSNASVVASVAKVGGQSVRQSLAVKRMGANSIYGIVDIETFEKLVKAKASLNNNLGKIIVSALDYSADGDVSEATVELNNAWKVVGKNGEDKNLSELASKYAQKLVEKFGSVKIN